MGGAILSRSLTMGKGSRVVRDARDTGSDPVGRLVRLSPASTFGPPLKLCSLPQKPQTTRKGWPEESAAITVCIRSALHARQISSTVSPAR